MTGHPRPGRPGVRSLTLGVAVLLGLSACGGAPAPEPRREVAESGENAPEAIVAPRPGMVDVEPVQIWFEHGGLDEHTTLVTFGSQGPPCQVLDRIEVDEIGNRVTITLYHGRDPEFDPAQPCDGPLRAYGVEVPLERVRWYDPEDVVLINGGSTTDRVEFEAIVTPRPGMVDVEPVRWWYDYGRWDDDHTLLVTFASQGPPCEVLDRIEVDDTGSTATITLYQGRDPDIDPDEPCDGPTRTVGVEVPVSRSYGPAGVSPYVRAGMTAESGEGPVVNGGSIPGAS
jgi:hypothetical protein